MDKSEIAASVPYVGTLLMSRQLSVRTDNFLSGKKIWFFRARGNLRRARKSQINLRFRPADSRFPPAVCHTGMTIAAVESIQQSPCGRRFSWRGQNLSRDEFFTRLENHSLSARTAGCKCRYVKTICEQVAGSSKGLPGQTLLCARREDLHDEICPVDRTNEEISFGNDNL